MAALSPREQAQFDQQTIQQVKRMLNKLYLDGYEMGLDGIQVDGVRDTYLRFEELTERVLPTTRAPGVVSVRQLESLAEEVRR